VIWRGDGAAERASLENWRPRKGSASSNLAPSAMFSRVMCTFVLGIVAKLWLKSVTVPQGCIFSLNVSSSFSQLLQPLA
jgi:hypothetical protein